MSGGVDKDVGLDAVCRVSAGRGETGVGAEYGKASQERQW